MKAALGIDACREGWFYFRFVEHTVTFGVAGTVAEILAGTHQDSFALIDMPMGLRARGKAERQCDVLARAELGPRRSSVFAAPLRPTLRAKDYASASEQYRRLSGRGLSRQSWNLVPKIRELDQLLQADEAARAVLHEAHPELLFAALAGGPMTEAKKTRAGFTERMTLLSILHADAEALVASAFLAHGGFEAARDDVVDAFVLALCARKPEQLLAIPAEPEIDSKGLAMQMHYLPGSRLRAVGD